MHALLVLLAVFLTMVRLHAPLAKQGSTQKIILVNPVLKITTQIQVGQQTCLIASAAPWARCLFQNRGQLHVEVATLEPTSQTNVL
jgi:hypothetical protein